VAAKIVVLGATICAAAMSYIIGKDIKRFNLNIGYWF